ncbi:hypothetical protein [Enemella sp. A6]|uniref:hypothetical protein n=1 Tax=Enemella sp. A6 TaxID=3440152 RepID=UPI003EB853C2
MGLFGNLFSSKNKRREAEIAARMAQEPPRRLVGGFPKTWSDQLDQIIPAVDLGALLALYESLDTRGRYLMLEDLGKYFDINTPTGAALYNDWMERLSPNHGATPHAKMVAGVIHQAVGWFRRSEQTADKVAEDQWADFRTHLLTGLDLLTAAGRELNNTDIVPFLHAQTSAYATGEPLEVAQLWQAIDPFNRLGLFKLGAQLDERWFGDSHHQLALAEYIAQNVPEGHDSLVVAAELVIERWEFLLAFHELSEAECDQATVENEWVQGFLKLAYTKMFKSGYPVEEQLEARHLSLFAWCFYWGNLDELANEVFRALRGRVYAPAWTIRDPNDDPILEFEAAREYLIDAVELGRN